ncbi:phage tail sheath family protein [Streptomyces sp. AV19]|uniref:phage tail sheath family protein n=1 Tax=Streptomyces sp. AV19 TaxID=2793068 RepID=UPI0018FE152A|nr:phage tail sheath subtilisin-like domain-containing protein [Streptomyces sp. AV19]MBH1939178.1 phage tail sheath family protein [Streptomyces sp. AV19]MDG4536908.1 phage tail sheath subtilisin-like domain-containing protein [Streptomyces sp. AV19]
MVNYLSPGVYVKESDGGSRPIQGVGTSVAAFVGFAEKGPLNEPVRVSNWNQFSTTFGDFVEGSYLAQSVYGYFANGGGSCYVVRVGDRPNTPAAGIGSGSVSAPRALQAAPQQSLGGFQVAALPAAASKDISIEVQRASDPLSKTRKAGGAKDTAEAPGTPGGADAGSPDRYQLVVKAAGKQVEAFDVSTDRTSAQYVVTQVRERSQFISIVENATAQGGVLALPENQALALPSAPAATPTGRQGEAGQEQSSVGRYVGDVAKRSGLSGLEAIDEVTMLAAPDLMAAYQQGALSREQVKAVQLAMISHCENMANRVAIIDPLPDLLPSEVHDWRQNEAGFDSKYAALYYPWVKVADPNTGKGVLVPPSGHVAGVWGRSDAARGVHKAPANEVVRGALDLPLQVTKGEQELLNPVGVNCIRSFPGRGIRVWGARTLSSDPAWRYLNVRRLFNYLEDSIFQGTQWVVFEPNDERLWAAVRRNITAFLLNEWRNGSLFGSSPSEAFYVKCDAETNPPEVIDAGQVVCEIGVAPVKPAEFVVFRLSQSSGSDSSDE